MTVLTIKQICEALNISRSRVDQWISRGHFRTPHEPLLGKPRDWDISDAIRLAMMVRLLEHNLQAEQAGWLVNPGFYRYRNDTAYFVAWSGMLQLSEHSKAHSGGLLGEIVSGSALGDFLTNPDVEYSIVVNLDNLYATVRADLERIGVELVEGDSE